LKKLSPLYLPNISVSKFSADQFDKSHFIKKRVF
jgi:hypothetical protein